LNIEDLYHAAREHADRLRNDIELAASRIEHIRLTARLNEAEAMAEGLRQLVITNAASTV
jgi:hypothetical protein